MKKALSLATLASVIALPASHSHSISEPATLFPLLPTWARRTRMHRYPPYTEENMFGIVTDTDL